jgi:NADPH2:quinone reductase
MMRQVGLRHLGGPEVLETHEVPVPSPKAGDILIRMVACGLNFIDIYQRTGLYPVPLPTGLGLEGAGIVEQIGEGVTRFQPGDRVAFCLGPVGAYAEFACVPETKAVAVPAAIDLETAAAILLKGLTAEFLIQRLRPLHGGDTVLFHAAAGGVGLIACDWLSHLGVRVIGTVGTEEKAELARLHGCQDVILYRSEPIVERVKALTAGRGCQIVYDSVGADTLTASLDCAARRGLVVSFGNASGPPAPVSPLDLSRRGSLFLTRPTLFDYVATPEELDKAASDLFALVEAGGIRPVIGARFPLTAAADAHRALESRQTIGATILLPTG